MERIWEMVGDPEQSTLMALFGYLVLIDGVRLGLEAVVFIRLARIYSSWNRACVSAEGRTWLALMSERGRGDAHPAGMWMALLLAGSGVVMAARNWVGENAGALLGRWLSEGPGWLAWSLFYQVFQLSIYVACPLLLIGKAMSDSTSPIGVALQTNLCDLASRKAARREVEELAGECPPASRGAKGSRRL